MTTQSLIEGYFYKTQCIESTSNSEQKSKQLQINYENNLRWNNYTYIHMYIYILIQKQETYFFKNQQGLESKQKFSGKKCRVQQDLIWHSNIKNNMTGIQNQWLLVYFPNCLKLGYMEADGRQHPCQDVGVLQQSKELLNTSNKPDLMTP